MREMARDAEPLFGEDEKPVAPLEDGRHEAGDESDKQREKNPPSDLVHKAAAFRFTELRARRRHKLLYAKKNTSV